VRARGGHWSPKNGEGEARLGDRPVSLDFDRVALDESFPFIIMSTSPAVLTLKRKALECKKAGDIEGAKEFLRQVKSIESLADSTDPDDLKKLAVLLNQNGDVQGAKEALLRSKQTVLPDPVNKAIDEATLEELNDGHSIAFTDEEMLDVETMVDMKASGMDIPSQQDYLVRATACKQAAVAAKQEGDMNAAKQHLLQYKQFEKAIETIFHADDGILEDDNDGEDYSLLDELFDDKKSQREDDGFFEDLFGIESTAVTLDDLDDLDPSMLRDMIESGMSVPEVDEVLANAAKKKADAVQFKKNGNLPAAKAALEECKRLEGRAKQLSDMLNAIETCKDDDLPLDPEAALEAMLKASEKPTTQAAKQQEPPPARQQEPLKSSHEYKVQAVTCKKEGRLQEAAAALQLYKQALVSESGAKAAEQRKECIALLKQEISTAAEQFLKFSYYQRFVDKEVGTAQLVAWKEYSQQCVAAIGKLENGGETIQLQRMTESSIKIIRDDDLRFIGQSVDPAEQRIEISILEIHNLHTNKNVRQILNTPKGEEVVIPAADSIRVRVTVQLPPSAEAPDDNMELDYKPQSRVDGSFIFGPSQYANAERGSSRFAKLLARRMTRKNITFDVFYVPRKKLFSRSTEEKLLGTAVIKLNDLLQSNVVAKEFPLLNKTRQHELGGCARIAVRTGAPFGEPSETSPEADPLVVDTGLISAVVDIQQYGAYALSC